VLCGTRFFFTSTITVLAPPVPSLARANGSLFKLSLPLFMVSTGLLVSLLSDIQLLQLTFLKTLVVKTWWLVKVGRVYPA
jgi:hypothetical protein